MNNFNKLNAVETTLENLIERQNELNGNICDLDDEKANLQEGGESTFEIDRKIDLYEKELEGIEKEITIVNDVISY